MRKSRSAAIAILPVAALILTACGGGGAAQTATSSAAAGGAAGFTTTPTGTVNVWAFPNADDVGKARLAASAASMPNVTVKLDATNFDAQKFTTRLAAGNIPDVVQMSTRYVVQYAAQKLIMPLDACYSAYKLEPRKMYYPQIIDDVSWNNSVWSVPTWYQPPAILVNKRVATAAGVSEADLDTSKPDAMLAAIAKMYKAKDGNPTQLGFDPNATGQAGMWILSQGGQLTDAQGVPTLDDPKNLAGVNLLKKITDAQGGFAKLKSFSDTFDFFGEKNQFVADQVGSQIVQQWYPNVLVPSNDKIQIAAVPFKGADGNTFAVTSGTSYVIPMAAKNKDAACAWMLGTISDAAWTAAADARVATLKGKGQMVFTGLLTGMPGPDQKIRETYVKQTGTQFDQVIAAYYDVLTHGKAYGASPAGLTIDAELVKAVSAALLGDKTPEQALADAQKNAKKSYDDIMAG